MILIEAGEVPGDLGGAGQRAGLVGSGDAGRRVVFLDMRVHQGEVGVHPEALEGVGQEDELLMVGELHASGVGGGDVQEGGDIRQLSGRERIGGHAVLHPRGDVVLELLVEQGDLQDPAVFQVVLQ